MENINGGPGVEEEISDSEGLGGNEQNEEGRDPVQSELQSEEPMEIELNENFSPEVDSITRNQNTVMDLRQVINAR